MGQAGTDYGTHSTPYDERLILLCFPQYIEVKEKMRPEKKIVSVQDWELFASHWINLIEKYYKVEARGDRYREISDQDIKNASELIK